MPGGRAGGGWRRIVRVVTGIGGCGLLLLAYASVLEPRRLQILRYQLGVPDLPPALEGVRIAHLTDFHVGMAGTRRSTLRRALDIARSWSPDVVALTGDFVHNGRWERDAGFFTDLARTTPTLAVLGNHDYRDSAQSTSTIVSALQAEGVQVLRNVHRVVRLRQGDGEIAFVAVDDPSLGRDNLTAAMAGLPTTREPRRPAVLLGHAPDIVDQAPPDRFALTLAGHTHGGQIRFSPFKRRTPLELPMIAGGLDSAYARGTHLVNGNPLFVNSGLGVSGIPLRFLAPPQVVCFTLTRTVDETKDADDPEQFLTEIPN